MLVLKMDVVMLRDRIAQTYPQLGTDFGDVLQQLDVTMQSMRAVIHGLRPDMLEHGLHAAVEWQCVQCLRRGVACELEWRAGDVALTDMYATALLRTLQECLTNSYRHAQANCVRIDVVCVDGKIVMAESDNGIGCAPADFKKNSSFGLIGIEKRIMTLGGTLAIKSGAQQGMRLTVSLPLPK